MKKDILTLLVAILSVCSIFAQEHKDNFLLAKKEFKAAIEVEKVQLIDVRTPEEYQSGTIEYARNMDYLDAGFKETILKLDKDAPVYLFCKSGKRSAAAKKVMQDAGFKKVNELAGGYLAWEAPDVVLLDKKEFKAAIEKSKVQLIDVRTPEEFKAGTIEYAENIDFLNPDFKTNIQQLNKAKPVYLFCKSGKRSAAAQKILQEEGFTDVKELDGGYTVWDK